ncbi:MAG: hypothetical protein HDQ98_09170 [Lachnospiraceae bacterium]|nr:hypothetical protein [Lachnospiraceae bacterium]
MAIDIENVILQQRELNRVSDEVLYVKRRLRLYQELLDEAWKGIEKKGIDRTIEEILRRLNRISEELEELGHDVMVTGGEIKIEEEAAEMAAEALKLATEAEDQMTEDESWQQ